MSDQDIEPAVRITMFPDGRLDTTNAARYLHLARQTLARKRTEGTSPPFVKIHGCIFTISTISRPISPPFPECAVQPKPGSRGARRCHAFPHSPGRLSAPCSRGSGSPPEASRSNAWRTATGATVWIPE